MYVMGGKHLNEIKSIYVNSLLCIIVKWEENECFRIESGVRQGFIMFPWILNAFMDPVVKVGIGRIGVRFLEEKERQ